MNTSKFDNDVNVLWINYGLDMECEFSNIKWDASDKLMGTRWKQNNNKI